MADRSASPAWPTAGIPHYRNTVLPARRQPLRGRRQLSWPLVRMWRGQWSEAASLATAVVERTAGQSMSRLMALLALGRLRLRRGDPGVANMLNEAQALAAPSGSLQRLGPTCAARTQAAFTRGDLAAVRAEVAAALPLAQAKRHPWFIGELAYWQWRTGGADEPPAHCAVHFALQISGQWRADVWHALGCPFEQARARRGQHRSAPGGAGPLRHPGRAAGCRRPASTDTRRRRAGPCSAAYAPARAAPPLRPDQRRDDRAVVDGPRPAQRGHRRAPAPFGAHGRPPRRGRAGQAGRRIAAGCGTAEGWLTTGGA
jgi:hypothetical protein